MNNKIYISAAGSGKTTYILNQAINQLNQGLLDGKRILIVTFTNNNQNNIRERILNKFGYIPKNIEVTGWYSFLLDYWIKPFKGSVIEQLYERHVGFLFVEGISGIKTLKNGKHIYTYHNDIEKFLDKKQNNFFSDKLAEFAYKCWEKNKEELLERLSNIVDTLFIDEAQDLVAWDFELMKILFKNSIIKCVICGDPRQFTYSTSPSNKHNKYQGDIARYVKDLVNTKRNKFVEIDYTTLSKSHRCNEFICKFASTILPEYPPTEVCECCLDKRNLYKLPQGVFLVKENDIKNYIKSYNPLSLRYSRATKIKVPTDRIMNWAESKGLEADSTLIYLTKTIIEAYTPNKKRAIPDETKRKFYVAITRARFAVGIVVPNNFDNSIIDLPFWSDITIKEKL